jgi:hypothetical protein
MNLFRNFEKVLHQFITTGLVVEASCLPSSCFFVSGSIGAWNISDTPRFVLCPHITSDQRRPEKELALTNASFMSLIMRRRKHKTLVQPSFDLRSVSSLMHLLVSVKHTPAALSHHQIHQRRFIPGRI